MFSIVIIYTISQHMQTMVRILARTSCRARAANDLTRARVLQPRPRKARAYLAACSSD